MNDWIVFLQEEGLSKNITEETKRI
jgi:hypothetical protein